MKTKIFGLFAVILALSIGAEAQTKDAETKAVYQAALDYLESIYEVKPELVERSVHRDLVKFGFYRKDDKYTAAPMTYEQLYKLAGDYNKDGKRIPKDAVKKVEVLDVADQTASAKVTADWGIDYMHLAKYEGKWKIIHILWQSPPKDLK